MPFTGISWLAGNDNIDFLYVGLILHVCLLSFMSSCWSIRGNAPWSDENGIVTYPLLVRKDGSVGAQSSV